MPYQMKYYYSGKGEAKSYVEVDVYWFQSTGLLMPAAICFVTSTPSNSDEAAPPVGTWAIVDCKLLEPSSYGGDDSPAIVAEDTN